jgi:hypothetical protein
MNLIRTSIVRQVRYADIRDTEDHEFSKRLMASGLLKTEFKINPDRPIYHYVDGVKEDRHEWNHSWNGDMILLYKTLPPSAFQVNTASTLSGNVVYPFLKLSRS